MSLFVSLTLRIRVGFKNFETVMSHLILTIWKLVLFTLLAFYGSFNYPFGSDHLFYSFSATFRIKLSLFFFFFQKIVTYCMYACQTTNQAIYVVFSVMGTKKLGATILIVLVSCK
jgi:hypothetical protein